MLNMNIPNPPPEMSYADMEDFRQAEILKANGVDLATDALLTVLRDDQHMLRSSAAHTLGAQRVESAVDALQAALTADDEIMQTEAAYALTRLGDPVGKAHLVNLLGDSIQFSVHPAIAAGNLAQLGDPQGYPVIVEGLSSEYLTSRMVSCKQLFFFVPHDGTIVNGSEIAIFSQFDLALQDPDDSVQWQALVQLRELRAPQSRNLLQAFVQRSSDDYMVETAENILQNLDAAAT